jgi:hypothetical protein
MRAYPALATARHCFDPNISRVMAILASATVGGILNWLKKFTPN